MLTLPFVIIVVCEKMALRQKKTIIRTLTNLLEDVNEGEKISVKCTKKAVKYGGGSLMVSVCSLNQGTSPRVRLQTGVNTRVYKNLLEGIDVPNIVKSDRDPTTQSSCETMPPATKQTQLAMSFLEQQDLEVTEWPLL